MVSRAKSPQNVRVAARSRILGSRTEGDSPVSAEWLPSELQVGQPGVSATVSASREAEAVPADPPAAAELGAEVQRLRRDLRAAEKRTEAERNRAEQAEREVASLRERAEAMKRAAAQAAALANPEEGREDADGRLDLNSASFEQLRAIGLSVTQAARLIGQREQHGGFASVDDVDGIVGIPKDVKRTLREQGSV
jgi:DNA uptake protein ComE-like DNA-binding protein